VPVDLLAVLVVGVDALRDVREADVPVAAEETDGQITVIKRRA
jgi:hypothetical protein